MIRAKEKFRVAREERNIPRRRREKDVRRVYCWVVGWKVRVRVSETRNGRMVFVMQNKMNTLNSIDSGVLLKMYKGTRPRN